jgi:hypothetical protein
MCGHIGIGFLPSPEVVIQLLARRPADGIGFKRKTGFAEACGQGQVCVIEGGLAPVVDLGYCYFRRRACFAIERYMRSDVTQSDVATRLLRFVNDLSPCLDISLRIPMAQPKVSWNLRETIESISPAR